MAYLNSHALRIRILRAWLMLALPAGLLGCNYLFLSERQKIVKASHEAVCKDNDFKAMRPFVSKSSVPILEFSSSLTSLTQILMGSALSDRIAVECHAGDQRFVDEIKVNDERYIVRTKNPGSESLIETVVVFEDGAWKIALLGR